MKYLLDTNTCIRYLTRRAPNIVAKMPTVPPSDIAVCSIVKAELFFGSAKSNASEKTLAGQREFMNQFHSFPFDDAAALQYAHIRAQLEKRGTPIGPNDLMIAAITMANNLILVTHNIAEFSRVEGLKIEDWEA